jgi:hypothetical protein
VTTELQFVVVVIIVVAVVIVKGHPIKQATKGLEGE